MKNAAFFKTGISFLFAVALGLQGFSKAPQEKQLKGTKLSPQQQQEQQKQSINHFDKKKRRHGQWEFYWDDDSTVLANKGEFKHGEQIGTWTYYNQDGSLLLIETKRFWGKRYKTVLYHPNGKVHKEGYARISKDKEYINYYWYGNWKCYDENGNYLKTERYKEGELVE